MQAFMDHFNYWVAIIIMMIGLYGVIAKRNLIKQAISLSLFSTGIFLFYISMAVASGPEGQMGTAPIWVGQPGTVYEVGGLSMPYDNPLPHVLMLTAIVVSVSILAVALAIIVNIRRAYGTIEEDEILDLEARESEL